MEEENQNKTKPKSELDEAYWYSVAKDIVTGSLERLEKSIDNFERLVLWLWVIYTPIIGIGAGTVSSYSSKQLSSTVLFFLMLPCITMLVSYWFTTKAKSVTFVEFNHEVVDNIKAAYKNIIDVKNFYFKWSQLFILLSFLSFPISLWIYHLPEQKPIEIVYNFTPKLTTIESHSSNVYRLTISGLFPKSSDVTIYLDIHPMKRPESYTYQTTDQGILQTYVDLSLEQNDKPIKVTVEWKENDEQRKSIVKVVSVH